jgi:hypothetical protein
MIEYNVDLDRLTNNLWEQLEATINNLNIEIFWIDILTFLTTLIAQLL